MYLNKFKYFTYLLTALMASVTLSGCILEEDTNLCEQPGNEPPSDVVIRFSIASNRNLDTRAADLDGQQPGSLPEDYIDVKSFQFLLFDADQKFLQYLNPAVTADSSNSGEYIAVANFSEPYFTNAADGSNLTFYIMALANGSYMGASWVAAARGETTIEDLCGASQNSVLTALPDPEQLLNANNGGTQKFPMSGLQNFTVAKNDLKASTSENPVDLSDATNGRTLNMLRALTKIEVIDHVNYVGGFTDVVKDEPDRIASVEIYGFFNRGNQLPLYSQWMRGDVTLPETQQVVGPSIPANTLYSNPPEFKPSAADIIWTADNKKAVTFAYDSFATEERDDKAPVYSAYLYEYNFTEGIVQQPFMQLTTKGNVETSARTIPFRLGEYKDGIFSDTYYTTLLRNHIYRFEITGITPEGDLKLIVRLVPWLAADVNVDYN